MSPGPIHRGEKLLGRSMQTHYMPEKFSVKKKSQRSRPESWAIPPTQHMLLSRSSFLCIPPPTHSPAVSGVTTMGHVDGHSETERAGKCLRHKTSKLVSSNTENEGSGF